MTSDWDVGLAALQDYAARRGCRLPVRHPLAGWLARQQQRRDLDDEQQAALATAVETWERLPTARWMSDYRRHTAVLGDLDGHTVREVHAARQWMNIQRERVSELPAGAVQLLPPPPASEEDSWRDRVALVSHSLAGGILSHADRRWLKEQHRNRDRLAGWQQDMLPRLPSPARQAHRRNTVGITSRNAARTQAAAGRTAEQARAALAASTCRAEDEQVLRVRVEHPAASLRELAAMLGMTKDAYGAALRRALAGADRT
ncbi:Helicase associated domain protein [Micromonospora sp. NPDC006766]|uniref:Helicase associated domain protein n=1 Tax=Micromonospora sp. NPDC006766 TaxID=3154778 RepID=UPI0033D1ECB9